MLAKVLTGSGCSSIPTSTDEVEEGPRGRVPRPGPPPRRGDAGGLPGRPQGVLLAGLRGLARRPDPASRLGIRRRRVPGPDQESRIAPRRRRGDRLRLPRGRLGVPAPRGAFHRDRHQPARRWRSPGKNARSTGSPTGSISGSAIGSRPSPTKARSTRSSRTLPISRRRRSTSSSRGPRLRAPDRASTAARADSTWSPD